jgi:predicted MFS family arabinose efflux permease
MNAAVPAPALSVRQILLCSAVIVTLSMGVRHGFGLWLAPITGARGWNRETFAIALAVQNRVWGLAGPVVGMIADRWGATRVLVAGAIAYAAGLVIMAYAPSSFGFVMGAGVLIGAALSATTYSVVYGVIGRGIDPARRSWAMGLTASAGSFGQFLMVPVSSALISGVGWQASLVVLGAMALLIVPLSFGLHEKDLAARHAAAGPAEGQAGRALRVALRTPSFLLLTSGYFVCGFQVVFIGVHMPSYLKDHGLGPEVATVALALIGLFNVFGTYLAGVLGERLAKRHVLASIYALRSVAIVVFLALPLSPLSVYVFAAVMGFLWLSTVPLTNAIVAQMFGVRHLSMLGAMVFLSHQVGSFLGVWLGGRLYDATGSYDVVWWLSVALGVMAALVHLPIREAPVVARAVPA